MSSKTAALAEMRRGYGKAPKDDCWPNFGLIIAAVIFVIVAGIIIALAIKWEFWKGGKKTKRPSGGDLISICEYEELSKVDNYNMSLASSTETSSSNDGRGPYAYINDFND